MPSNWDWLLATLPTIVAGLTIVAWLHKNIALPLARLVTSILCIEKRVEQFDARLDKIEHKQETLHRENIRRLTALEGESQRRIERLRDS